MALFDDAWMKGFQEKWNAEPALAGALEKINFKLCYRLRLPERRYLRRLYQC